MSTHTQRRMRLGCREDSPGRRCRPSEFFYPREFSGTSGGSGYRPRAVLVRTVSARAFQRRRGTRLLYICTHVTFLHTHVYTRATPCATRPPRRFARAQIPAERVFFSMSSEHADGDRRGPRVDSGGYLKGRASGRHFRRCPPDPIRSSPSAYAVGHAPKRWFLKIDPRSGGQRGLVAHRHARRDARRRQVRRQPRGRQVGGGARRTARSPARALAAGGRFVAAEMPAVGVCNDGVG